jgi:hypothetical protein
MTTWGKNYTKKCLRNRNQETSYHVTNLLMFSIRKVSNKRCRTEFTRNILINAGNCANYAKADTQKCWKQYIIEDEKINKGKKDSIKNDKHLIPLLCWLALTFESKFLFLFLITGRIFFSQKALITSFTTVV